MFSINIKISSLKSNVQNNTVNDFEKNILFYISEFNQDLPN